MAVEKASKTQLIFLLLCGHPALLETKMTFRFVFKLPFHIIRMCMKMCTLVYDVYFFFFLLFVLCALLQIKILMSSRLFSL